MSTTCPRTTTTAPAAQTADDLYRQARQAELEQSRCQRRSIRYGQRGKTDASIALAAEARQYGALWTDLQRQADALAESR